MKTFAVLYFGLLASRGLGNAQSTSCTSDVAIPFSVPGRGNNDFGSADDLASDGSDAVGAGQDGLNQAVGAGEQGVGEAAGEAPGAAQDDLNQAVGSGDESTDQAVQDIKDEFAQTAADNSDALASRKRELPIRRRLNKRADFSCASDETCYIINNGLFCVNGETGIYHEPDGSVGNIISGNYTLTDGQEGNIYSGPIPTLSSGVPSVTKTSSLSVSASSKPATDDETSSTAISAEASPTSTNVESRLSGSAPATSNAPLVGSRTSSTPKTGTSTSTPSSAPGNGASSLQSPNIQLAAMTSIIAGFLLWGIYLF